MSKEQRRFTIDGGVVVDTKTSLMWKRDRQRGFYMFVEAMDAFEQHSFRGYDDWRMPTQKELLTIVGTGRVVFPGLKGAYWARTDKIILKGVADYVSFDSCKGYFGPMFKRWQVRLVRGEMK